MHKTTLKTFKAHYCGNFDCYNIVGDHDLMACASQYVAVEKRDRETDRLSSPPIKARRLQAMSCERFTKGDWYPCSIKHGPKVVMIFNGSGFNTDVDLNSEVFMPYEFNWIGESLGKIDFNGGIE